MENIRTTRIQLAILYICGYVIAVVVAVATVVTLITMPTVLPDNGAMGSFYGQVSFLFAMFYVGLFYTGVSALPGYVISLIIAQISNFHSSWFYVFAGVATAILAHILFGWFVGFFNRPE